MKKQLIGLASLLMSAVCLIGARADMPSSGIAQPPAAEIAPVPPDPQPGTTYPLRIERTTRAVRLTVFNLTRLTEYGAFKAPAGRSLIVMDTEWENIIPLIDARDLKLATTYKIPNLADHLYLVAGGKQLIRLNPDMARLPGHLPVRDFTIEKLGDRLRGNLIFEVSDGPIGSLELRFYDFAHGHMVIPLGAPVPADKPVAPPLQNDILSAALYDVSRSTDIAGRKAPAGMTFITVDLRATSRFTIDSDATAFDPAAKPGQRIQMGTVSDWTEAQKYAQMVADGQYGYLPIAEAGTLGAAPRFLPDLPTGGTLTFLVPQKVESLELRCDFPNAKMPDSSIRRPEGLTLAVEGKRPALAEQPAIASAKDEVFDVAIVGQQAADSFAEAKPGAGKKFLVLDVTVRNVGAKQEFFQPKQQLKYTSDAGQQIDADKATQSGIHAPSDLIYIPSGERRTFQMAYQIATSDVKPRLMYMAVTQGASKIVALNPLDQSGAVTAAISPQATPAMAATPDAATPRRASAPPPTAVVAARNASKIPAPPRQHGPPRGLEGAGISAQQVNDAIDKGARGLWALVTAKMKENRESFGAEQPHVLVALALVHADAHKKIPEFDAALRAYLTKVQPRRGGTNATYVNALLCMLIQAYGDPTFDPKLREAARWILESEGDDGTWTYTAVVPETLFQQKVQTGVLQIVGGESPDLAANDAWVRQTPWKAVNGDNSCTQFAILGLQAAAASGVQIPAEAWQRALNAATKRHCSDGGWNYNTSTTISYGSMTSAGICATAITRYQVGQKKDFGDDPNIVQALGWLDRRMLIGKHPGLGAEDTHVYYYTYSIERVGRILDTEFIGEHEWYPELAAWLVHAQHPDGTWVGPGGDEKGDPRLASSFALLFLTRATPPLEPIARHGPGMLKTAVVAPDNRFYIILDASGSMLDPMDGKMKFDIAKDAVRALVDKLPPNSEVALRVYGHRKRSLDPGADEDTELKIKMAPLDKAKFNVTLDGLRSRGKTPMALSIESAIKDLGAGNTTATKPLTMILLTDGGEDTTKPRGNPVKAARELVKLKDMRFHIVGFDINQPEWSEQLQAMAAASNGRYWPAARGADLQRSVLNAVLGIPEEFSVVDPGGKEVARGKFGDEAELPEGKYTFRTAFAGQTFDQPFYISPRGQTVATFDAREVVPAAATAAVAPAPVEAAPASTAPWPKFCAHCGAPLQPGQKFCAKCGQAVQIK